LLQFEGTDLYINLFKQEMSGTKLEISEKKLLIANKLLVWQNKEKDKLCAKLQELVKRTSFLAAITENIGDAVISTDNDHNITKWNKAAETLLEWKSSEVIGKNATGVLRVNYMDKGMDLVFEFLKGKKRSWLGEVIYLTKSGTPMNVSITASLLKDFEGNVIGNLILVRDISLRKKAETDLSKLNVDLEEKMRERTQAVLNTEHEKNIILESIADAFFAVDKNWTVTYWNRTAETVLKVPKYEIVGKNLWKIFSSSVDSTSYNNYHDAMATGKVVVFEDYYPPLKEWYEISAYPSQNGLSVYFKTITERKTVDELIRNNNAELEEKVQQRTADLKKANEELEAFSYSVSHDLRAPLRGMIGFASILEEEYGQKFDQEAKRITGIIKANTLKMGALVDDLLAFSRLGRQEIIKVNVNMNDLIHEIINDSFRPTLQQLHLEWVVHELPCVQGDSSLIKQVWINLLSNAVKYCGKTITPKIEVGSIVHADKIIFYVKDNGAGFDEKYKDKLFKVFQRLHGANEFEGTGIGLAIIEKIITKHGGAVWATAKINEGANFFFSLPKNEGTMIVTEPPRK